MEIGMAPWRPGTASFRLAGHLKTKKGAGNCREKRATISIRCYKVKPESVFLTVPTNVPRAEYQSVTTQLRHFLRARRVEICHSKRIHVGPLNPKKHR
jgi:hypothetical protein